MSSRSSVPALDGATELNQGRAEWSARLFPAAGEAIVFRDGSRSSTPRCREAQDGSGRARRSVRRYALSNDLRWFVTLTYRSPQLEHSQVKREVYNALRAARRALGAAFPYVSVVEQHPGGHGLHVHALLPTRAVAQLLAERWDHGLVDVRRLRSARDVRRAAEYASKSFDCARGGGQRYSVAEGFVPERVEMEAGTERELWQALRLWMGREPDEVISVPDWPLKVAWWFDPPDRDETG